MKTKEQLYLGVLQDYKKDGILSWINYGKRLQFYGPRQKPRAIIKQSGILEFLKKENLLEDHDWILSELDKIENVKEKDGKV